MDKKLDTYDLNSKFFHNDSLTFCFMKKCNFLYKEKFYEFYKVKYSYNTFLTYKIVNHLGFLCVSEHHYGVGKSLKLAKKRLYKSCLKNFEVKPKPRIRGLRANSIIMDEMAFYNPKIVEEVLKGFGKVPTTI